MIKDRYQQSALQRMVGMTYDEALAYLKNILPKDTLRVVMYEGRGRMVTLDMRFDRHDIEIMNGVIIKVN